MQSKIRSLATDTMVYGVSTVVGRFLTFLLTPLYSNYLTASEIGDVTAVYSMIAFINIAYSLGLEPALMRFWDTKNEDESKKVFYTAFLGVTILSVFATVLVEAFASYLATSKVLQLDTNGTYIVRLAALIPLFDALVLMPFLKLRMQRRSKEFAIRRFVSIILNVAFNLLFLVTWGMHVEGVVLAGVFSSALTFVFFLPLFAQYRTSAIGFKVRIVNMLRYGLPTVPASVSSIMVQVADRPLLLMMTGSATVGMYQTNFRLAIPLMMFVTVFEYAWKPFYLTHRDDEDAKATYSRVLTLFTVACGLIFLVTAFFMPYLVRMPFIGGRFINPLYWDGMYIIPIVMFAYYFNGVFINIAAGLHITMKTGWLPVATGVAAVLNVAATLLLTPQLGFGGAAWAKVIAYIGGVVVLMYFTQKVYPIKYDIQKVLIAIVLAGALFLCVNLVSQPSPLHFALGIIAIPTYLLLLVLSGVVERSTFRTLIGFLRR